MKIAVLGAGGLGLLVAARLARAGTEVVVVCRDEQADMLQERGVEVVGLEGFAVAVSTASSPAGVGSADFLIVAVKAPDTEAALARVAGGEFRGVLSLQNGGVKDEQLASVFGWPKVIGAATMLGATLQGVGRTAQTLVGTTYFGEISGGSSARVEQLTEAFRNAGMEAKVAENILSVEWSKLCRIVPGGLLSALSRLEFYKINRNPDLALLFVRMTKECAAVARAVGVAVGDYDGLAIRYLAESPVEAAVTSIVERGIQMERSGQTAAKISMLQDVLKGRRTEVEETAGYVVRRARELGVAVPNVEFAYRTVRGVESYLSMFP